MSNPAPITGYRTLSADEIALMNEIKAHGEDLQALVTRVQHFIQDRTLEAVYTQVTAPARWAAIGQTHLQEGLMALTRAVAAPTSF